MNQELTPIIPSSTWDTEKLFFRGDEYFESVVSGIQTAQRSVDFETYIFKPDEIGRKIETALIEAAKRGVRVRLLVDGIGAANWIPRRSTDLEASGVELRIYHPVYLSTVIARVSIAIGLKRTTARKSRALVSRLNRRTHRKMCLVDKDKAWIGSLNVAGDHSESVSGTISWRDTAILVCGREVDTLTAAFQHVWIRSHNSKGRRRWRETLKEMAKLKPAPSDLVNVNYTKRLRSRSLEQFISRIHQAKKRIWITNAYYAPSKAVAQCLVAAAKRGVDVRLLLPRQSDVFFMPWVSKLHYRLVLEAGVHVFEYLPRFLHAKSSIVDDTAIVGSSNLNRRSLLHDFEVDVRVTDPKSVQALIDQFNADLRQSEEVLRGPMPRLKEYLGRLAAWLLRNWI